MGSTVCRDATIYSLKCSFPNKSLQNMQRKRKVWPDTGKKAGNRNCLWE